MGARDWHLGVPDCDRGGDGGVGGGKPVEASERAPDQLALGRSRGLGVILWGCFGSRFLLAAADAKQALTAAEFLLRPPHTPFFSRRARQ